MVGVKVPNPDEDYAMTDSAVLLALRELQQQKERAEKKRLLYVALTRARDHLFMSGTQPKDAVLSFDLAKSRLEWVFTALGITAEAIAAGSWSWLFAAGEMFCGTFASVCSRLLQTSGAGSESRLPILAQ